MFAACGLQVARLTQAEKNLFQKVDWNPFGLCQNCERHKRLPNRPSDCQAEKDSQSVFSAFG